MSRSADRIPCAQRRQLGAGGDATPVPGQPEWRIPRQARGAEAPAGAKEAERATIGATVAKLEATLPIVQERFDVRKTLYGKELGAKLQYLEAQQQLVEMQQELAVQKSRYSEVTAALTVLTETNAQTIAEYRRTRFGEFAEADRKVAGLVQDLVKAEQRTSCSC